MTGDLTIKGVTRPVELDATVEGAELDLWGNERVGIRVRRQIDWLGIGEDQIQKTLARELDELRPREAAYRHGRPPHELKGKTVILVDDGLATGASMQAAARGVRRHEPARIVISVPVASRATCDQFRDEVDEVVCAVTPAPFYAVGNWYEDFSQTSDEEVRELLERAALNAARGSD